MSHLQSRMYAAMEEAQRARQKKREAADALRHLGITGSRY